MKTDLEIQKDVKAELEWEPSLSVNNINVMVKHGVVTLSGKVDAFYKRDKAEKAAKRVAGVITVFENLDVELPSDVKKTDFEIEEAAVRELKWNTSVREDKVKVEVKNGIITLEGEVEWEFQRSAIRDALQHLAGVQGIINNVVVKPTLTAREIKKKINLAFHRNAGIDAEKINVETDGAKVTLTGKVKSWHEKNEAEITAWQAPGITRVENNIEVV